MQLGSNGAITALLLDGFAQNFGQIPLAASASGSPQLGIYGGRIMGYYRLADTIRIPFGINTTAGATNADSTPTVTIVQQGTPLVYAPVVSSLATGEYEVAIVANGFNGFAASKEYTAYATAVVGGITLTFGLGAFSLNTRSPDDLAYPAVSGRSLAVDASGGVLVGSYESGQAPLQPTVAGRTLAVDASGNATVGAYASGQAPLQPTVAGRTLNVSAGGVGDANVATWLAVAVAALTSSGYVQVMLLRWLTDNAGGTPNALATNRVDVSVGAYQSGQAPLQPAVAGRTLAVDASGNVSLATATQTAIATAVWSLATTGNATAGSFGEAIVLALAICNNNAMIDNWVYDGNGLATSARVRGFASAGALASAVAGHADGADSEVYRWTATAVDNGSGKPSSFKLARTL